MRIMLIIACIGHIICGITDCMFAYSKNGRFDFANMKDEGKMKHVFSAMSLRQIEIGMMLGVVALFLASVASIIKERSLSQKVMTAVITGLPNRLGDKDIWINTVSNLCLEL